MHNPKTTQSGNEFGNEFSYNINSHFCNSDLEIITKFKSWQCGIPCSLMA
jgi:hypothetical protein